ncbi:hypothetical protein DC522_27245 [Microvirga sp. KLBC 81]|nr:hypothetical protein DC522_27245 [Microvirga sp. KLBC 81]
MPVIFAAGMASIMRWQAVFKRSSQKTAFFILIFPSRHSVNDYINIGDHLAVEDFCDRLDPIYF